MKLSDMAKGTSDKIFIYGKHAVAEALEHAPRSVRKVYLAPQFDDEGIRERITRNAIPHAELKEGSVREMEHGATHQGIIAEMTLTGLVRQYDTFIKELTVHPDTAFVLLDELQDPHNVGAIIRSAAAFGISGVLIPQHNQAPITGTVVKVSAGMAFRVPLVSIGNVNSTLRDLKERGFWIYGLEGEGGESISGEDFSKPSVIVIGNESEGIRQKTKEHCDILLAIPMSPRCESLNAAAAASVALYAWSAKHPNALV
ncbi:MAG: 23S rRNA (guanosine(2251)-2'-O)-methyltransferase RlmB [Parcubacteria group bacterium]|nr:23S rRNA (guanosine(2251)-2'-O)-methyltransferase RlmB [Parcubacteria group bacterium]